MTDRLIPLYETTDANTLQDFWLITASTIEGSLIEAGAEPGKDYNHLALYKLAQPIVMQKLKEGALK